MKPTPRVCGPFIPDPAIPADHQGRQVCTRCHLIGRPGDPHHPISGGTDIQKRAAGDS